MRFEVKFLDGGQRTVNIRYAEVYLGGQYTEDVDQDELTEELKAVIAEKTGILTQNIIIKSFKFV